jgi:hypothetical protein
LAEYASTSILNTKTGRQGHYTPFCRPEAVLARG